MEKGYQGYVAAWYVSAVVLTPPAPSSPPPGGQPAGAMVLYALADGLALHNQPVISNATLIKREPPRSFL